MIMHDAKNSTLQSTFQGYTLTLLSFFVTKIFYIFIIEATSHSKMSMFFHDSLDSRTIRSYTRVHKE